MLRAILIGLLIGLALIVTGIGSYNAGAAHNRVTPQDMSAYAACMAYYHNAPHCYQDVIGSWQR